MVEFLQVTQSVSVAVQAFHDQQQMAPSTTGSTGQLAAGLAGLLAVPVVAWSEYTLKTTGNNARTDPALAHCSCVSHRHFREEKVTHRCSEDFNALQAESVACSQLLPLRLRSCPLKSNLSNSCEHKRQV